MLAVSVTVAPARAGFGAAASGVEVAAAASPVPLREIDCVAALTLRSLSVRTNDSENTPTERGLNSILRLQPAPAVTVPLLAQSGGVPVPATRMKSVGAVSPDAVKSSVALPSLPTATA